MGRNGYREGRKSEGGEGRRGVGEGSARVSFLQLPEWSNRRSNATNKKRKLARKSERDFRLLLLVETLKYLTLSLNSKKKNSSLKEDKREDNIEYFTFHHELTSSYFPLGNRVGVLIQQKIPPGTLWTYYHFKEVSIGNHSDRLAQKLHEKQGSLILNNCARSASILANFFPSSCYCPPTAVVSGVCPWSLHGMQHQKNMESEREKRGSTKRKPV